MKNDAPETGPPSLTRAPPQLAKQPDKIIAGPAADKSKTVNQSPKMPPLHKKPTDSLPPMPQLQPRPGLPPAMPILQPCPTGGNPPSAPGTPLKSRIPPTSQTQLSPGGQQIPLGTQALPDAGLEPTQPPAVPTESGQVESVPIAFLKTSDATGLKTQTLSPIKPEQATPNSPSQAKNNPRSMSHLSILDKLSN